MYPSTSSPSRRDFVRLGLLGVPLAGAARTRSCILIWQSGGASHLDTFDMKPGAPREVRGEFRAIPTSVPGIRISEHLPRIARQMHQLTLLRSMCCGETNHERARRRLETGQPFTPARQWPGLSEVVRRELRGRAEQYGETRLGRGCLAARLAVEAGARLAVVDAPRLAYDTHTDNFRRLKEVLLPEFDRAFARLIDDLADRGLLSSTLVIALGEFGRSPRINAQGGRDHHSKAWSVLLAGAGLPGGRVLGATDRYGEEVTDLPVAPEDLLRTVYELLGVGQPTQYVAQGRRIEPLLA
jgi:hypothetical protein